MKRIQQDLYRGFKMAFFLYRQNNSGGHFVVDDNLSREVAIEADTEEQANDIAEGYGIYFNGVSEGIDCPCCGDRWYSPDEITFPYRYSHFTLEDAKESGYKYQGRIAEI